MNLRLNAAGAVTLLFVAIFFASASRADYIVNGGEFLGTYQIRDDGTGPYSYYFPSAADRDYAETYGEDAVVTPDLQTLYQFTNSLGTSNVAFIYDAHSSEYQSYTVFGATGPFSDATIWNAQMSLIRDNDPLGLGDMFVISGTYRFQDSKPQIKRFNRATSAYVETIDPPTDQSILDFGFGPDDRLYMAAETGIFVYDESATGFDLVSGTPLLGTLTGKLTFGPDGRMYLVNPNTQRVERYAADGSFVDTFSDVPLPGNTHSIQFGVDGNIHVLAGNSTIQKIDGSTGDLLATINFAGSDPFYQLGAYGRITYLPVPEPNALLLAAVGSLFARIGSRRGRPR